MTTSRVAGWALPAGSTVPEGWIAGQARQNLDGFLGALPDISAEVGGHVFAAGRLGPDSAAVGGNVASVQWWNGESEGNWLIGYAGHVRLAGTEAERLAVAERIGAAVARQDDDGYLGMFTAAARAANPWLPGDCWTSGRLLLAIEDWANATDDHDLTEAVDRAVGWHGARYAAAGELPFATVEPETAVRGHDLQLVDLLLDVARRSGAAAPVELADALYRRFSAAPLSWVEDDGQLGVLLSATPLHGHGPHVAENLRIPLRLYEFSGDARLLEAARNGWSKLIGADGGPGALGVTGALRSDETVGAPDQRPWPVPEAGYEYCAITELAITAGEFARILDLPEAADLAESLWLNAAQAARSDDGTGAGYFFAENQPAATKIMGARWDISPTHDDAAVCCVPNAGRILPAMIDRSVMEIDGGLRVQFYGPMITTARLGDHRVQLRQRTDYPFSDTVRLELTDVPQSFVLELRVPGWCADPVLEFATPQGPTATIERSDSGHLLRVTGPWPDRATLTLTLPRTVRQVRSVDGRTALAAGPLIFAVPIDHREQTTRTYPGSELTDRDLVPVDPRQLHPPYLLGTGIEAATLITDRPGSDPWREPGLAIEVEALDPNPRAEALGGAGTRRLRLLPIGCTMLRYTCLPVLDQE
ncbi:beta-L-arabinofuranosidase domain-containing protein [Microlunatus speluncae]|uniref:beta-L-arabinofuranosidase domain-containing protein n=1 Tax=Microlunatus speluncae TaxID=2594267 RepID=UPI0012664728|nr:beta-L-arabinofuranosidase domain-containing protein [Microlunatus speluncae]